MPRVPAGTVVRELASSIAIRELRIDDVCGAFTVMHQLRGHLDEEEFQRRVSSQRSIGYTLFGAFDRNGALLGLIGMRPVMTLSRGRHLHVDDLVVDERVRGNGLGKLLIEFAERWASDNSMQAVFLDSQQEVIGFYSTLGYERHSATLMRKRVIPEHF